MEAKVEETEIQRPMVKHTTNPGPATFSQITCQSSVNSKYYHLTKINVMGGGGGGRFTRAGHLT